MSRSDHGICKWCGETYNPDSGECFHCDNEDCWSSWCCQECAKEDGLTNPGDGPTTCSYCRLEKTTDTELLEYVLHHTGWTRESIFPGWYYDKVMGVKYQCST